MTNLPITSSNPQSPARSAPLPAPRPPAGRVSGGVPFTGARSDPSAVSANTTSAAQTNDMPNAQSVEPFGAVLARQMNEASPPASIAPSSAIAIDAKTTADSASSTSKGDQDKALAIANIPNDPASTLIAMLQLPIQKTEDNRQQANSSVLIPDETTDKATSHLTDKTTGETTSHLTRLSNNDSLVIGYSHSTRLPAEELLAGHPKDVSLAAGYQSSDLRTAASLTQPTTAQAITSSAIFAVMPNALTNNKPADTPQTITTPLGNNGWPDEFSQKIRWMSTQQNQVAELHLNPPNLGPLDVVLKISGDQATALFTSPHSTVRDAIENALPKLREILADNGITLGNTTVSDQSPRDRSAEQFMNQGSGTAAQREASDAASESTGLSPATAQIAPTRRHNGMVDTFA